ncbi:CCC motif membrane protein [Flavobacterium sp. SUN052]|uniref:CCC motif membrane protein n=1 Tax=Flavobacterium sp. SUN052 TaxID=3002441 RepID=UPI00237D5560|nr:CCC motif membrane protein [Flavobacterium sp. SUN052]MEC4003820.1 CCC motif membrane protein [Flavobacterium sp. SUN052]
MENQKLPNATAVLVLGILSILTCICYGGGLLFGVIALVLAAKDMKAYRLAPENYDNYQNLNIGRILSIIGLVLSILMIIIFIWVISIIGMDALGNEDLARERLQDYLGQ